MNKLINMANITTAFFGVAHIDTPAFDRRLNARSGQIKVKSIYDHDDSRRTARASELSAAFAGDAGTIINDPEQLSSWTLI